MINLKGRDFLNLLRIVKEDMLTQKRLLQVYQKALARLPKGRLCFKLIEGKPRYFKWDEKQKKQIYIRKQDEDLVYELKYRRILEEAIQTIEQNLKVQEKLIQKYQAYDPQSCQARQSLSRPAREILSNAKTSYFGRGPSKKLSPGGFKTSIIFWHEISHEVRGTHCGTTAYCWYPLRL